MKLEVGMYVRTRKGKISKIINKYDNSGSLHEKNIVWVLDDTSVLALHSQKVVKSSYNIIDLIEVGDYVNGERVIALEKDIDKRNIYPSNVGAKIFTDYELQGNWYFGIQEEDIKSIVTKEQFENAKYKIGE